jgi:GGDEF domain-containing protein
MMAGISEINELARIQELDTNSQSGGHHSNPYYRAHHLLQQQSKPEARTSRQIKDTAFVMGIPIDEITPRVHEAMTLIMHEMDAVRWELGATKKHEAFLVEALDHHEMLPVVSRHAFNQYLIHASDHVERTKEPSFLLFLKILNVDNLWQKSGSALRDGFLIHAANVIKSCLEEVDVVGALDNGEIGVIFNLYQEEAVIAQANVLTNLLKNSPLMIDDVEYPISIIWGSYEILAQADPAQMILTASENARNQSV